MRPNIKKLLKIPFIVLFLALLSAAWLWFGEGGFVRLYRSEAERQTCIERIHKLAAENQALLNEVHLLRTDMQYLETVARRNLNLIKENEVVYRFDNESSGAVDETPPPERSIDQDGRKQ
ncbi:MAG: septum formation initiator family protein [Deltaproteobacteria bacterium]|nr:septum formation initiator family protein [Deltaproteobacteria bacterium]